jgi:hypothetical protein
MTFANPSSAATPLVAGFFRVQVQLDWTGPGHYAAGAELPCRICTADTPQRDELGEPAHQACVQSEMEARGLEFLRSLVASAAAPSRRPRPSVRTRRSLRPRRREAVAR